MTYKHTAHGIASLGRNGDDTLLHVKKSELEGLQALLGPVTVNPDTGLPEAFNWTDILGSLAIGTATALTGGAAAAALPEFGLLSGVGAGALTGGALGGGLSAAQGKGFGPGAMGGALTGAFGGFAGSELAGGMGGTPTKPLGELGSVQGKTDISSQLMGDKAFYDVTPKYGATNLPQSYGMGVEDAAAKAFSPDAVGLNKVSQVSVPAAPATTATPSTPDFGGSIKNIASKMVTTPGLKSLAVPVGTGALAGAGVTGAIEQSQEAEAARKEAEQRATANKQQMQDYYASLGFPLTEFPDPMTSDWNTQQNYIFNLLNQPQQAAAGGEMVIRRGIAGIPIQTTLPPKYAALMAHPEAHEQIPEALNQIGQQARSGMQGFQTGGYVNTTPFDPSQFYPQSRVVGAQPYAGAAPNTVIDTLHNGASFAEGGLLEGDGDGMSDDIPANIDGEEEVRLADGEFVVPAELVRMIGNGDHEEGTRLLDQLLPLVRRASYGTDKQVKQDAGKKAAHKLVAGGLAAEKMNKRAKRG